MLFIRKKINNLIYSRQYYNNYFSRCINSYKKIGNYISLYDSFLALPLAKETATTITHTKNITFGMSLYHIKKLIDEPYRLIKNRNICDIMFYKTEIGSHKMTVELHFFLQKLVFFKYTFSTLENKTAIKNIIKNKYFHQNISFNFRDNLIIDNNNNYLKVEDGVSFIMYYFSTNFGFYDFLIEKKKQENQKKLTRKERLLNKLIEKL